MGDAERGLNIEIVPKGELDLEMMRDLSDLEERLREAELQPHVSRANVPGVKDASLAEAISIASLALTGVSTLISVLTFWASQRPRYTVTVDSGKTSSVISGLDKHGMLKVAKRLKEEGQSDRVVVRVDGA